MVAIKGRQILSTLDPRGYSDGAAFFIFYFIEMNALPKGNAGVMPDDTLNPKIRASTPAVPG